MRYGRSALTDEPSRALPGIGEQALVLQVGEGTCQGHLGVISSPAMLTVDRAVCPWLRQRSALGNCLGRTTARAAGRRTSARSAQYQGVEEHDVVPDRRRTCRTGPGRRTEPYTMRRRGPRTTGSPRLLCGYLWTAGRRLAITVLECGRTQRGRFVARVVLVHGIGQQLKGQYELLGEWLPALRDGLSQAGSAGLAGPDDAAVGFYGDLFRLPGHSLGIGDPLLTAADVNIGLEAELLEAWWTEAARVDRAVDPPDADTLARWPKSVQAALLALSSSGISSLEWYCGAWCSTLSKWSVT